MTNLELVAKLKDIVKNYKTLYVNGCFGAPIKASNVSRYTTNTQYNKKPERTAKIKAAADTNPVTFGFDCVCVIKGLLWGWNGDKSKSYGGAQYASNNVPDIGTEEIISVCSGVSTDFSKIEVGELVHLVGHVGIYLGDGLVAECTPAWQDGVQITACGNIGKKTGYNTRTWLNHGKLPYVTYVSSAPAQTTTKPTTQTTGTKVSVTLPVLKNGDKVAQVKTLQRLLKELGYKDGSGAVLVVDGSFGAKTKYAVGKFQQNNALAVNYQVDAATWNKLLSGSAK